MLPGSDGDNAAGSGAGRAFRITGYSYDANHRVTDVVRALQVPGATPASDPAAVAAAVANALPDENAQVNLRTRVQYDDDGNVIREYGPRAFLHTDGSATSAPNLAVPDRRHLTSTTYDSNSRIIARFVPRADSAAGPLADPTGEADQSQQCRTGTAGYPAGVGVCISEFGYDSVGNVVTVKLPTRTSAADSSRIMTATYTDDNLRRAVSGPDPSAPAGNSRSVALNRREYDGAGRTVATINALDQKTTYTYSADGLLEGETAPPGQSGQLVHDVRHDHDDDGNRIRTRSSRSTYEPATGLKLGNRNETDFAATEYYADGLVRSVVTGRTLSTSPTDTSGDIRTSYVYDGDGNAVEVKSPSANALDQNNLGGVPTRNTYTPDNLLATSTVPVVATTPIAGQSRVTTYSYDPAGRKTRTVHALSNVPNSSTDQLLSYYPSDLVKTQTGRDEGTGRPTITATYDAAGSPTSTVNDAVTSPTHSTTATYYLDGLLRTFSNTAGASDSYSYDGAGTVLARSHDTTSTTPVTTTYATNNAGLPVTMQAPTEGTAATTSGYDQLGRLATRTRSNGLRETWDYDTDGLLTAAQVQTPSGNVLASNTYTHDEFGRIITQAYYGVGAPSDTGLATSDVPAAAPVTYRYTYDPGGRLSSFTDPIGTRTITFDRNGNRTAFGTPGQPRATTFTYRADDSILGGVAPATPLAAVPTQARAYTHMTWGGVAHDGCSGYSYDGFDRLTEVGRASEVLGCTSGFATYQYDGLDRQVIRTDKTANRALISITAYNYDGGGQTVSGQVNTPAAGTSNPLTYVLDTDGAPLTGSYKGKKQFLFEDGTGSIGLVTGTDKAVLCTARYDAFGNPAGNSAVASAASCNTGSADTENFYRGGRRDGYTGAYQLGSRTYDPSKSAFLTPDSYRTEGSVANAGIGVDPLTRNSYTYVNGDPVNFKDPSGHRQIEGDTGPAASGNVRSDEGTGDGTGRWRAAGGAIMGKQVSYYCATCNRKAMALLGETGVYEGLEDKIVRFGVEDYEGCATGLRGWSGGWKTAFSCAVSIPILKPLKGLDLAADAVRSGNKLEAGRVARDAPTAAEAGAKTELPSGYSSFSAAKRNMGSPGQGNVFDHVVEQSQIRRSGFAPEEIHNPFNMNPVSAGTNQLKANYYSSKQPFTGGGPVRDWLSGQSFADQYEFGIDVLRKIQNGIPLS
jgi:RHS repeat-associated protein